MSISTAENTGDDSIVVAVPGSGDNTVEITVPPGSVLIYDPTEDNGPDLTDALANAGALITTTLGE